MMVMILSYLNEKQIIAWYDNSRCELKNYLNKMRDFENISFCFDLLYNRKISRPFFPQDKTFQTYMRHIRITFSQFIFVDIIKWKKRKKNSFQNKSIHFTKMEGNKCEIEPLERSKHAIGHGISLALVSTIICAGK